MLRATMLKSKAIKYFGGQREVANAIGFSRQAVYQWKKVVPADCAMALQIVTDGELEVDWSLYPVTREAMKRREKEAA